MADGTRLTPPHLWPWARVLALVGLLTAPAPQSVRAVPLDLWLYAPVVQKLDLIPIGTLNVANASFEDPNWMTDWEHGGNQYPASWATYWPPAGAVMPFPTKWDNGQQVPAISDGWGEYIHKYDYQLPSDEQLGQPRGLILEGHIVYKAFAAFLQQAIVLSQTVAGDPGAWARVTAYILGEETHLWPPLEYDHFVASVKLGDIEDKRPWAVMVTHYDVPGNTRNWNKFVVAAQFPESGQLPLIIVMQQNWRSKTDFFIDNITGELLVSP